MPPNRGRSGVFFAKISGNSEHALLFQGQLRQGGKLGKEASDWVLIPSPAQLK